MGNMVTGIFCEQALDSIASDKEVQIGAEVDKYSKFSKQMKEIFERIDKNSDNVLTAQELEEYIDDEQVKERFHSHGINITNSASIFQLLDLRGKGSLTLDEFLSGCFRIKAASQGIDVPTLLYENKRMVNTLQLEIRALNDTFVRELRHVRECVDQDHKEDVQDSLPQPKPKGASPYANLPR